MRASAARLPMRGRSDISAANAAPALGAYVRSWICGVALSAALLASPRLGYPVLFCALIVFGVGHGALDHVVIHRAGALRRVRTLAIVAVYLGVAALAFRVYLAAPGLGFAAFLVLSAWHFGATDETASGLPVARARDYGEIALRGATPLLFGVAWRGSPHLPWLVAAFVLGVAATRGLRRASFADVLDVSLPAVLLSILPFGVGFAVYYVCWHSLRHVTALRRISYAVGGARSWLRFFRDALPLTVAGTLVLALGALYADRLHTTPLNFIVAALFAVTVPHEITTTIVRRARARAVRAPANG